MNWFKYRLPNSADVVSGASDTLIRGLAEGFAVAPFLNPADGLFTIPSDFTPSAADIKPIPSDLPSQTSPKDYFLELDAIIRDLDGSRGKTVAARIINVDIKIDIEKTFDSLAEAYPEAFVFAFSTQQTGTWIGASPELLLRKEGDFLHTMALAGTRPSSPKEMEWDEKNREEQDMVAEFIMDTLTKHCGASTAGKTFTKKAGPVEHICTPISAYMPDSLLADEFEESYSNRLRRLLAELSPTPALCGSDRSRSLELIRKHEKFQREMYGGFCGPNDIAGVKAFFVILRAAKVSTQAAAVFSGGGITIRSSKENEWNETELKSKTIISKLKSSEE